MLTHTAVYSYIPSPNAMTTPHTTTSSAIPPDLAGHAAELLEALESLVLADNSYMGVQSDRDTCQSEQCRCPLCHAEALLRRLGREV